MSGRVALDGRLVSHDICRCAILACALQLRWQAARLRNHVVNSRRVLATNRPPAAQETVLPVLQSYGGRCLICLIDGVPVVFARRQASLPTGNTAGKPITTMHRT